MLQPSLTKNDKKAKTVIYTVSIIVFAAVTILGKYNLAGKIELPFNEHIFATANAVINACVAVLLIAGLLTVKNKNYQLQKKLCCWPWAYQCFF